MSQKHSTEMTRVRSSFSLSVDDLRFYVLLTVFLPNIMMTSNVQSNSVYI